MSIEIFIHEDHPETIMALLMLDATLAYVKVPDLTATVYIPKGMTPPALQYDWDVRSWGMRKIERK